MDKLAILEEIKECYGAESLQPDDLTVEEVAAELGTCNETARKFMRELVAKGKFDVVTVIADNHKRNVYRKR